MTKKQFVLRIDFYKFKRIHPIVLISILLLLFGNSALAQKRVYQTERLSTSAPLIDGFIDDEAWETIEWGDNFIQRDPYENAPPSQQTAFKILYDDNNIYVAIRAYDSIPEKIEKRLTRRDGFQGDWVAVAFDSYNDDLTAFVFSVNASGVKGDVIVTNDTDIDETWNPVWYVKTSIDELGWVAEMKIPLTQLRFSDKKEHVWGLEVMRQLFRKEEFSIWQMVPQEASGWVSEWGELRGIKNINPKKEIELLPYAMLKYETSEKEEGNPFATGSEWGYNAGLDGKVAITNDLTLNFTVNPDFGQVEADPSEVNLTAFESFFEEKRPFFVEGANIFDYPLTGGDGPFSSDNLFYSRRIGRQPQYEPELADNEYSKTPEFTTILGAAKLSGKTQNGWSIGILESLTREEKAIIDNKGERRKETVEPLTNFFNTRIQKDINKGNTTMGGIFTATNRFINDSTLDFLPKSAYTGGLDFANFWDNKSYYLSTKAIFSTVNGSTEAITELQESPQRYYQRPDANHLTLDTTLTSLTGTGGTIEGGKIGGGHWSFGGWSTWRSPGLELNDQGYLRGGDFINQVLWVGYRIWEPFSIFRSVNINAATWGGWDFGGQSLYKGININLNAQFTNYWRFGFGVNRDGLDVNRHELRGGPALLLPGAWNNWINISTDNRKKLSLGLFMHNRWFDNKYAHSIGGGLSIEYRPLDFLQISLSPGYFKESNSIIYIETIDYNQDNRYITSHIDQEYVNMDIRIDLSITPDLSIQYWGQPFIFSGDYSEFKKVVDPMNKDISQQYHIYNNNEISYDEANNKYLIDETGNGITDYTFGNPDFSFFEFRSNLVIRWEYIPGSTAYLVWSQGRTGDHPNGQFSLSDNINRLSLLTPSNTFLLKVSYRFSF